MPNLLNAQFFAALISHNAKFFMALICQKSIFHHEFIAKSPQIHGHTAIHLWSDFF